MRDTIRSFKWMMLFALPLLFVACNEDDEMMDPVDLIPQSIVEIAAADGQFTTLVEALTQADLVTTLEGDGPFTVFAPTNAAFEAAGIDLGSISKEALTEVLLYHVLGGELKSSAINEGQTYVTTAATNADDDQYSMLVEKTGSAVKINGSINVTTADVDATNGVIHIVDNVILPLDVVGHASANEGFSSLVTTLGAATGDLVTVLQGEGPFTVFAPDNAAFAAISDVTADLTAEQLNRVLTYHVLEGNIRKSDLSDMQEVPTVNSETFTVNIDGGNVTITDAQGGVANVTFFDVQATNGVIHVLESVILPESI